MNVLITGASGFLGRELTHALLTAFPSTSLTLTDITTPSPPASHTNNPSITTLACDLTSPPSVASLLTANTFTTIYLLHGIMSSGSESNLPLSLAVNIDSFRLILAHPSHTPATKIIFPSSLAVYGPTPANEIVNEQTCPYPQSTYGAHKLVVETLLNDFSRRGLVDGRIARLPTVMVRPGAPTAAASSFASGIVREPLSGKRAVLPVEEELEMWVCSGEIVVRNLVALMGVEAGVFGGHRVVCLPGQSVTVGSILGALEEVAGKECRERVVKERDGGVEKIVKSWPARFDTSRAASFNLLPDIPLKAIVENFAKSLKAGT